MKKLILAAALLAGSTGVMSEGEIFDPWDTPTIHTTCTYPIEREDGTMLLLTEIGSVDWYLTGPNSVAPITWGTALGNNVIACEYFVDITGLSDGQYYVTATVTDTDARMSDYAVTPGVTIGAYAFEVSSYVKPPKSLTNIMGVGIPR